MGTKIPNHNTRNTTRGAFQGEDELGLCALETCTTALRTIVNGIGLTSGLHPDAEKAGDVNPIVICAESDRSTSTL